TNDAQFQLDSIRDVSITTQAGSEQSPVLDLAAKVQSLVLTPIKAQQVELTKLESRNLSQFQQEFGGFIPALKDLHIEEGEFYTNASLNYENDTVTLTKPFSLSIKNLSLQRQGAPLFNRENFSVSVAGKIAMPKGQPIVA